MMPLGISELVTTFCERIFFIQVIRERRAEYRRYFAAKENFDQSK
jgi:hypothetical protein